MTTLSPTKARANLTSWLKAAAEGQDVGILYGEHVIALRPVTVESADYALREYGATPDDLRRVAAKANEEIAKDRKAGRLRRFQGDIGQLLADQAH